MQRPDQCIEIDGQLRPVATMLRKGTAFALDLCLTVALGAIGFAAISMFTPLDGPTARAPVAAVMVLALVYLAWGRDRFASPGRRLFRLALARLPGPVAGLFGRQVSVHVDPTPPPDARPTSIAMGTMAASTLVAAVALAVALTSTNVYRAVQAHVRTELPLAGSYGSDPVLSRLPRALLIARERAYVQVGTRWGEHAGTLEFFLARTEGGWQVQAARETHDLMLANYSLGTDARELPPLPH